MVARVARTHVSSGYPGSIPGPGVTPSCDNKGM